MLDGNGDGMVGNGDPTCVTILDLVNQQEWQLTPPWLPGGLGGLDWSGDSQFVYFGANNGLTSEIFYARIDGSQPVTLLLNRTDWSSDLSLSFDGTLIAYHHQNTTIADVWVVGIDGSNPHEVSTGNGTTQWGAGRQWGTGDYDPEFSPDGQFIVLGYKFPQGVGFSIVRVRLADGSRTELYYLDPNCTAPAFQIGARTAAAQSTSSSGRPVARVTPAPSS